MRKIGLPFKIISFLVLFLVYALFGINHAITTLLEHKPASKIDKQAKSIGEEDGGFILETPYMSVGIKGLARGIGFVYTSF